jgi:hypothetical protein
MRFSNHLPVLNCDDMNGCYLIASEPTKAVVRPSCIDMGLRRVTFVRMQLWCRETNDEPYCERLSNKIVSRRTFSFE